MSEQQVSVERLEVRTDDVAAVTDLVNAVYAVAEDGMWLAGTARTDRDEIECCAREGTVRLARLDGQVVGCIRVVRIDDTTAEFGMLAVDPTIRGKGIGQKLIDFTESECAARGFETMQLEVIRPRDRSLESKIFLDSLYTRLGYVIEETASIESRHPELEPALAVPCEVVVYRKPLGS